MVGASMVWPHIRIVYSSFLKHSNIVHGVNADPQKAPSSAEYWRYSNNELGTHDVPALLERLHDVNAMELKSMEV
jgi:hypothetical protein